MVTITTAQILAARSAELRHCTWNDSREIGERIKADAAETTWLLLDDDTYATPHVGSAGPCVLSIFGDTEPSLVFGEHAEAVLEGYEITPEALREAVS